MNIDFSFFWVWVLLFTRMTGLFYALPGIGTEQVPDSFRMIPTIVLSVCAVLGGIKADLPVSLADGGLMIVMEFTLGYIMGFIPLLIISGLTVAGQLISGSIGLGQANMIDHSLGETVSVLSRIKYQLGILFFLLLDGHLVVIKCVSKATTNVGYSLFKPGTGLIQLLTERLSNSFEMSIIISAPIIVAALLTQFVLGLIAKFVPQVNVFLISMPLSVLVGFYMLQSTLGILAMKMNEIGDMIFNSYNFLGLLQ